MPGLETRTQPKPLAHIIAEFDDDKLDEYLQANGRIVSVQDPENIQPSFIRRLRDKVHTSREAADSRPVDFAQLAARLHDVSAGVATPARALSPSPTPPLLSNEEQDAEDLKEEIGSYSALLEAGGRPPYPRRLLNDFFWEPEQHLTDPAYRNIITFWRSVVFDKAQRTLFCASHLLRWGRFCRLQQIIRQRSVKNEWTLIDAATRDSWEEYIKHHGQQEGNWSFGDYTRNIHRRLNTHGFSYPVQFEKDLENRTNSRPGLNTSAMRCRSMTKRQAFLRATSDATTRHGRGSSTPEFYGLGRHVR